MAQISVLCWRWNFQSSFPILKNSLFSPNGQFHSVNLNWSKLTPARSKDWSIFPCLSALANVAIGDLYSIRVIFQITCTESVLTRNFLYTTDNLFVHVNYLYIMYFQINLWLDLLNLFLRSCLNSILIFEYPNESSVKRPIVQFRRRSIPLVWTFACTKIKTIIYLELITWLFVNIHVLVIFNMASELSEFVFSIVFNHFF